MILIIVSHLLYMHWKPAFALILLGVTVITYARALLIERYYAYGNKRYIIGSFAFMMLLSLIVFKYYNFIIAVIYRTSMESSRLNLALPIGISFFTFQALWYLFDVHYRRIEVKKSFADYLLFFAFYFKPFH